MRHKCVTAGWLTELDQTGDFTIDFTITLGGVITTYDFRAGGRCRNNWPCDGRRRRDWYRKELYGIGTASCQGNYEGTIGFGAEYWSDIWYVPYRFYRLTKVELYHWDDSVSGFTVTYNVPDDDDFENWPELTHHFGYQNGT